MIPGKDGQHIMVTNKTKMDVWQTIVEQLSGVSLQSRTAKECKRKKEAWFSEVKKKVRKIKLPKHFCKLLTITQVNKLIECNFWGKKGRLLVCVIFESCLVPFSNQAFYNMLLKFVYWSQLWITGKLHQMANESIATISYLQFFEGCKNWTEEKPNWTGKGWESGGVDWTGGKSNCLNGRCCGER